MRVMSKGLSSSLLIATLMAGLTLPATAQDAAVDFGDDSSEWANDGECDDPRFTGTKMAAELLPEDTLKDATDCKTLFDAGEIALVDAAEEADASGAIARAEALADDEIDFGDDSSQWANDLECDDPRFVGQGMSAELLPEDEKADATDCRQAYEDGTIRLAGDGDDDAAAPVRSAVAAASLEAIARRIDFGDDSGEWANDGECDDPDFFGPGASNLSEGSTRLTDASDCRAAFLAGDISLKTADLLNVAFDFGDDSSRWANDGECDDPRFTGPGLNKKMLYEDIMSDATDCKALFNTGDISIKPVYTPEYALGAPYDTSSIDFGDDTSSYANDAQCDDPRFEGPGVAGTVFDSDTRADATDCKAAFESGKAALVSTN